MCAAARLGNGVKPLPLVSLPACTKATKLGQGTHGCVYGDGEVCGLGGAGCVGGRPEGGSPELDGEVKQGETPNHGHCLLA